MKIKVWMGISLASLLLCGSVVMFGGALGSTVAANDPYEPMGAPTNPVGTIVVENDPYEPMTPVKPLLAANDPYEPMSVKEKA